MFATISSRFNTLLLMLLVLMAAAMIAILARGSSAGPLDPPSSPASTLPQVEPRSPIAPVGWNGTSPITIGSPGSYFLTRNLVQVPITIDAENVAFELNGFTLSGSAPSSGIAATPGTKRNIVIRNGALVGWSNGIRLFGATRSTFSDLDISGAASDGLYIGSGNVVSRVRSHNNQVGILVEAGSEFGGSIDDSDFSGNTNTGIHLVGNNIAVRDTVVDANGNDGIFIEGSWNDIADSRIVGNATYGLRITGNRNVIVHNHIDGNLFAPFGDGGAGNIVGPIAQTAGGPAANIGFP